MRINITGDLHVHHLPFSHSAIQPVTRVSLSADRFPLRVVKDDYYCNMENSGLETGFNMKNGMDLGSVGQNALLVSLGDSLAFPRSDGMSAKSPADTWPERVWRDSSFDSFWFRNRGGSTSNSLHSEAIKILKYIPDETPVFFLVQCGIVDATPRPLPRRLYDYCWAFLKERPKLTSGLYRLWGRPWVKLAKFEDNFRALLNDVSNHPGYIGALVVAINEPGTSLQKKTIPFSVHLYNEAIREITSETRGATFLETSLDLHEDGHHLTGDGHSKLAFEALVAINSLRLFSD